MKRQHPTSSQLRRVKVDGLLREEMNRNSVGIKSIENDETVMMGGRFLQLETGVTQDYFRWTSDAFLQVSEIIRILRDADNGRIDFVESPTLIGTGVACH